jgi:hypothetical protein
MHRASPSATTSCMTGAAGSKLCEVAGCHRVRRRCARYVAMYS